MSTASRAWAEWGRGGTVPTHAHSLCQDPAQASRVRQLQDIPPSNEESEGWRLGDSQQTHSSGSHLTPTLPLAGTAVTLGYC